MSLALMDRVGFEVDAIDVFCGYGGSSQGIHAAGATVRAAANHSELSIECHAKNFPDTDHWHADLVSSDSPQVVDRNGKKVAGRYLDPADLPRARFAWFSPSCTHHSQANAKKVYQRGYQQALLDDDEWDEQEYVNSERSRVTMSCVLRYCEKNRPEIVVVENVIEVTKWGPGKDGSTFRWWLAEIRKQGYEVQCCFFNSMFFPPCPQSRDRIYIVCWRKGNTRPDLDYRPPAFCASDRCSGRMVGAVQTWKRPTKAWLGMAAWGKYLQQYDYRCPDCSQVVHPASWMALSAIDWTNLGPTLGERKQLPAESTMERIRRAIRKYWWAPPVLLPPGLGQAATVATAHSSTVSAAMTHSDPSHAHNRSKHVGEQLPSHTQRNATVLQQQRQGVVAAVADNCGQLVGGPVGSRSAGSDGQQRDETTTATSTKPRTAGTTRPDRSAPSRRTQRSPSSPLCRTGRTTKPATLAMAAGNTFEWPNQTRARHQSEALFTQSTTGEFALAALPVLRGDHFQEVSAGEAMDTVSAAGFHHSLVTALFSKINGGPGDTSWHTVDEPLNTVTGRDTHGLVLLPWVDQWRSEPALITEQLAAVTTHLRHSLASIEPYDGEITDEVLMSVRFRMLEPDPELRRAMAFGDEYILIGNKGQKTAGLGNAVTPPVASWITERCLATLRGAAA